MTVDIKCDECNSHQEIGDFMVCESCRDEYINECSDLNAEVHELRDEIADLKQTIKHLEEK